MKAPFKVINKLQNNKLSILAIAALMICSTVSAQSSLFGIPFPKIPNNLGENIEEEAEKLLKPILDILEPYKVVS